MTIRTTAQEEMQQEALAAYLRTTNPRFNRERWLGYVRGENGPGGGAIKGGK